MTEQIGWSIFGVGAGGLILRALIGKNGGLIEGILVSMLIIGAIWVLIERNASR